MEKGSSGYLHHQESGSFEAIPHRRAISSNGCPGNVRPDSSRPELHHVCRFGERDSVINMFQPFGEIPRFVRRLEMATHHEGSVLIARTDPPDRLVGHQVGREALLHLAAFPFIIVYPALRGLEKRVPIFPLVMENRKGVETRRLRLEMPFAEKGSLIPSLLHAFRNIVQSRDRACLQAYRPRYDGYRRLS